MRLDSAKPKAANLPSRQTCQAILREYNVPANIVAHMQLVAQVAVYVASKLVAAGESVNIALVDRAALLHDLDKIMTLEDRGQHGLLGARLLRERGYPEIAAIIEKHPLPALTADFSEWSWEARLVHYADKVAKDRILPLRKRLERMRARHPEYEQDFARLVPLEEALERSIWRAIGENEPKWPAQWVANEE